MKRRDFLKSTGAAMAGSMVSSAAAAEPRKRPNVVFIITDQQSGSLLSCAGNPWLKTPAMDYIAGNGVRFERAYSTNPVCCPARIGFMTGRFPGSFNTPQGTQPRQNRAGMSIRQISPEVQNTHIGAYLKRADYEMAYAGKTHLPGPLSPKQLGFNVLTGDSREECARRSAEFVRQEHQRPYCLITSFINPHDICFYAINNYRFGQANAKKRGRGGRANDLLLAAMKTPGGITDDEFFAKHCPPLPPNYEPQADEPKAVRRLIEQRDFRNRARREYSEKDWRLHRWAYDRLTERVDRQVQTVLDALRDSGQEENTVVILTSDHGDMDSAHRMEHKTALYEEAARLPLLVMHKGTAPAGRVDDRHLVSNGLDLLPTVCDYAGIGDGKADSRGRSLRPLIEGKPADDWRETLGVESEIGRMVVGDRAKYVKYDFAGNEEQLLDLKKDPGETRHFTNDPDHAALLADLRTSYNEQWFPGT